MSKYEKFRFTPVMCGGSTMAQITSRTNMEEAVKRVRANKGAPGLDGMGVGEIVPYLKEHGEQIVDSMWDGTYKPSPARRTYIEKENSTKKRPLGIPVVIDRVVQQAIAQVLSAAFEPVFHPNSFGYRPGKSAHQAIEYALGKMNEGYEWVVDFDIEGFFDNVNHDKLISLVRKEINDQPTLHLIRKFLKAGVMENGVKIETDKGTPQGSPVSPVLSLIYLNELDWELDKRGLPFCRYADDFLVLAKSEKAANRIMKSVSDWIERKLFLKVSPTKTKVVRPSKSQFLGFTFLKSKGTWRCKPTDAKKKKLKDTIRRLTCRRRAMARPIEAIFEDIFDAVKGWIDYYRIGMIKSYLDEIGGWMRRRIRVILLKQWKNRKTIIENLTYIYEHYSEIRIDIEKELELSEKEKKKLHLKKNVTPDYIYAQCMTRKGIYSFGCNQILNTLLHPFILCSKTGLKVLMKLKRHKGKYGFSKENLRGDERYTRRKDPVGLIDPLRYYERHKYA